MTKKPEPTVWMSDARGIYLPRDFARSFTDRDKSVANVTAEEWAVLDAGPEHEHYWEVWGDVTRCAIVTLLDGTRYHVHQDGDCWLVPVGMEWSDEQDCFVWPSVSYKAEVIADNSGKWCGNMLRFATRDEALAYVKDLSFRWTLVRDTRVVECDDPVTHEWVGDKAVSL